MHKDKAGFSVLSVLSLIVCALILMGLPVLAQDSDSEQVIEVQAKRFDFTPSEIILKKDIPVVLELTSQDVKHGFNCPGLGLRADIYPGKATTMRFTPKKTGNFTFYCDVYCGEGHEDMTGVLVVTE
jgi:cytochrome c oxidase subunit II